MRNLKHTIIAIAAIVMVGTLSVFQVSDMSAKKHERDMKLSTANQIENITIASTENEDGTRAIALPTSDEDAIAAADDEPMVDAATEQAIAEKSYLTLGYANVTGSAELKAEPNPDAAAAGSMNGADQVEILESTDGWYKVLVNGQEGYVESDKVTLDKDVATDSAMKLDHYKLANISADNGVTVRESGSNDAESIDSIADGDDVIIVDSEGDYLKVVYGSDYSEGYVINTGVETTGEWVDKEEVHEGIRREAERKLEAAKKEEIARKNSKKASASYSTTDTTDAADSSSSASSSSSKGQALVDAAKKYLGVPYVWGGTTPNGFDCSGLVQYVCRENGISVPRVAASQRGAGQYVSRENLQPGDLVFFSNGGGVSHVGIYCGNGNMIHAPQTGDVVKISTIENDYRVSHYAGAVRVW